MRPLTMLLLLCFIPMSPTSGVEIKAPYLMPVLLSATKVVYPQPLWSGDTKEKVVALTFDDGPSPFTSEVLDVLNEKNVRATFFVLGNRIPGNEAILQRMHREGHLIALHGMTHDKLHGQSDEWIQENVRNQKGLLQNQLGKSFTPSNWYYRPPFGAMSGRILRVLEESEVRVVLCSVLPGQQIMSPSGWVEDPEVTAARTIRNLSPGGIIGLHDGEAKLELDDKVFSMPHAAETTRQTIAAVREKGYRFVQLDELPD